jgi:hypothetical protein
MGSVGADLFRADGRTDMTKPLVAFRNFANAPKNHSYVVQRLHPNDTATA